MGLRGKNYVLFVKPRTSVDWKIIVRLLFLSNQNVFENHQSSELHDVMTLKKSVLFFIEFNNISSLFDIKNDCFFFK